MPAITGLESCSRDLPIRPRPRGGGGPRWRGDCPIAVPVWVSLSLAIVIRLSVRLEHAGFLARDGDRSESRGRRLGLGLEGLGEREHVANRLSACERDLFGPAQVTEGLLGRLEHVDRVGGAER